MISLIYFLIVFFMIIILFHFLKPSLIEGVDQDCSQAEKNTNSQVYKNAGKIKQQQQAVRDFKTDIESKIKGLSSKIKGFNPKIAKNTLMVQNNELSIKQVVADAQKAAAVKEKEMDKAAGTK
jgi:hypothetical protein